ncbi:hypothetical protein Lesp02_34140 [Lentzea sp. NBRC 105346]|nr:hypothetical protein Lesp02_34140 [Lentzea sp. NBRC 105346]
MIKGDEFLTPGSFAPVTVAGRRRIPTGFLALPYSLGIVASRGFADQPRVPHTFARNSRNASATSSCVHSSAGSATVTSVTATPGT